MSAGETALAGYRWENRVLLVFAPDADSALYLRQQEMLLVAESGLNERDIVIIFVIQDIVSTKERPAAPVSAVDLRDAYDVLPHEFRVVLIGKDGGVKLRQEEPILAADLFALIELDAHAQAGDGPALRVSSLRGGTRTCSATWLQLLRRPTDPKRQPCRKRCVQQSWSGAVASFASMVRAGCIALPVVFASGVAAAADIVETA